MMTRSVLLSGCREWISSAKPAHEIWMPIQRRRRRAGERQWCPFRRGSGLRLRCSLTFAQSDSKLTLMALIFQVDDEGHARPKIRCDSCGRVIENHADGVALLGSPNPKPGTVIEPIFHCEGCEGQENECAPALDVDRSFHALRTQQYPAHSIRPRRGGTQFERSSGLCLAVRPSHPVKLSPWHPNR